MKVEYLIDNGLCGCDITDIIEIDDEYVEGLDTEERDNLIDEWVKDEVHNRVNWSWKIVK